MLINRPSTGTQIERRGGGTVGIDIHTNPPFPTKMKPRRKLLQQRRTNTLPPVLRFHVEVLHLSLTIQSLRIVPSDVADNNVASYGDVPNSRGKCSLRMVASFEVCEHATIGRTDNWVRGATQRHRRYIGDRRLSVLYHMQNGINSRVSAEDERRSNLALTEGWVQPNAFS